MDQQACIPTQKSNIEDTAADQDTTVNSMVLIKTSNNNH